MKGRFAVLWVLLIVFLMLVSGCDNRDTTIKVGSKNFTESLILGEMYALALENEGLNVDRQLNLDGTLAAHEAMENGDIDLYPEYMANALYNILGEEPQIESQETYEIVSEYYEEEFDLIWLAPTQVNRTLGIVISPEIAKKYSISTLTDLQKNADKINFASFPEFDERKDGLTEMNNVYGDFDFISIKLMDYRDRYDAILNDEVQATVAFGTDGELINSELVLLEDDQFLWPPNLLAPVIRQDTLDKDASIGEILDELSANLDTETMRSLNAEVDINQREYADVAKSFLKEKGLIQE